MNDDSENQKLVQFAFTNSTFNKHELIDKKQKNGEWVPAFPPTCLKKQEEYIEKCIQKDKEASFFPIEIIEADEKKI